MILSYDITNKDNNPDSSFDSVKEEEYNQIETIMMKQSKHFPLVKPKFLKNIDSSNDLSLQDSSQLSKIDRNSMNKENLSRGEDCLQKEIIQMLSQDSTKKKNIAVGIDDKLQENSSDVSNSSQVSHKSKNYILKSSIKGGDSNNMNSSNLSLTKFNNNCMNYFLNGNSYTDEDEERLSIEKNFNISEHANKIGLSNQKQKETNVNIIALDIKDNTSKLPNEPLINPIQQPKEVNLEKNEFFIRNQLFMQNNVNNGNLQLMETNNNNINTNTNNLNDKANINIEKQNMYINNINNYNNIIINEQPKEESGYMNKMLNNFELFQHKESNIPNTNKNTSLNNVGNYHHHYSQSPLSSQYTNNSTNTNNISLFNTNIKTNYAPFHMNNSNTTFQTQQPQNDYQLNIIENCLFICREQSGCRLLQKKIDEQPKQASEIYYKIIQNSITDLSCDQFGNYFVQKIIEHISLEQLDDLLKKRISNSFCQIGLNQYGTRVLQKLFDKIVHHEHLVQYFAYLMQPCLFQFIIDPNATHIIIKFASHVQSPINDFLITFLGENMHEIAMQKHSCCTLQKCIEYSNPKQKHFLLLAIANISSKLFTDQYGNYVVQFAMSVSDFEINRIIVLNYLNEVNTFSSQKYSSNVIEKSLDCCDEQTKQLIIEKICNQKMVSTLLFDMYGNYVLQKAMSLAREPFRSLFIQMVGPSLENIKVLSFGQKLYYKLLSMFPELSAYTRNENKNMFSKKKNRKKNNILPQQQRPITNDYEYDYYGNNMNNQFNTNQNQANYFGGNGNIYGINNQFNNNNNVNTNSNIYGISNQLGNININNFYEYK